MYPSFKDIIWGADPADIQSAVVDPMEKSLGWNRLFIIITTAIIIIIILLSLSLLLLLLLSSSLIPSLSLSSLLLY